MYPQNELFGVVPVLLSAAIYFGLGVLLLMFGWHAYRVSLVVVGVLLGGGVGAGLASLVHIHPLIIALPLGILTGALAISLEKVGAFLVGGLCGAIPIIALRAQFASPWGYYAAAGLGFAIAGILALYIWRPVIVVFLAIIGASFIMNGIALAVDYLSPVRAKDWTAAHPAWTLFLLVVLVGFGVYYQTGEEKGAKPGGKDEG